DLLFENPGDVPLELAGLEATLVDGAGRLVTQRRVDTNGSDTTMSLVTIPNRMLPAKGRLVVFNPFERFAPDLRLGELRYEATFQTPDGTEVRVPAVVRPQAGASHVRLRLPLDGEVFVHDGHDLLSHHRRLDVTGDMTTHFGITGNMTRYAHDFVLTDAAGRMYRGDGARPEDWYGFGAPILAPGDGVVREARDGMADNRKGAPPALDREAAMKDLKLLFGNYVLIDHGRGEFSLMAHLKKGSVRVKPGTRVVSGAPIGAMGMSGDAFLVHLHYQLQSGPDYEEGLPARFEHVQVRTGDGWSEVFDGPADTGDVVRTAPRAR
ncbi:M23 family metallopeptidase, partial [Lysobacter xanthus]